MTIPLCLRGLVRSGCWFSACDGHLLVLARVPSLAEAGYRRGGGGIVRVCGAGLPEAATEMILARLDGEQVEAPLYVRATLRLRTFIMGRAVL